MTDKTEITINLDAIQYKLDEFYKKLSKVLGEGKVEAEKNIKEHPLPYTLGTLAGGIVIGSLIVRRRKK